VTSESERSATHPPGCLGLGFIADRDDVSATLAAAPVFRGASLPHSLITWAVSINARSGTRGRRRRDLVTAFHDADEIIGLPVASYAAVAVIGDALRATT
jgi:hypothetical protein